MNELARALVEEVSLAVGTTELTIQVKLDVAALLKLGPAARKAVYRGAARAVKPVKEQVVNNAMMLARYGFLSKSIGTKVKIYGGSRVLAVIGPKMSYYRSLGKKKRGPEQGQRQLARPYLYAWLVERGTKRSRAKPFLGPAKSAAENDFAETVIRSVAEALASAGG